MKQTITIKEDRHKKSAIDYILDLPLDQVHQVIIKPFKETLTDRQRRFYWSWVGIMGKEFGYTKDEMHETLKGRFLFKIMLEYPDDYPDIKKLVDTVRSLRDKGMVKEADTIAKTVAPMVSITKAKVPHMGQFLDEIYGLARENNISLPFPEERIK